MIDVGRYLGINAWINRQAWLGRGFWINEDDNIIFIEFSIIIISIFFVRKTPGDYCLESVIDCLSCRPTIFVIQQVELFR
jgi:hypothetical protein